MNLIPLAKHQPNSHYCGPCALRHGMLVHGYNVDVRVLAKESITDCCGNGATDKMGRCEHGLKAAAAEHGFVLEHWVGDSPEVAYTLMRTRLVAGPVLLCVDHYSHWILAWRGTTRHAWIVDSARGDALHQRVTWRHLMQRLTYGLPGEEVFHLYPLTSK